jgi:hypothetical protein
MTHSIAIKRPSQHSTAEDYIRPFILFSSQLILSDSDDIFGISCRLDFYHFGSRPDSAGPESIGNPIDF